MYGVCVVLFEYECFHIMVFDIFACDFCIALSLFQHVCIFGRAHFLTVEGTEEVHLQSVT